MRTTWVGRRQEERRTCSIKAQARFYSGETSDCVITDFSPTGARLVFPKGFEPPAAFDLFVPARADTRHALVRWRTPDTIGIEFSKTKGTPEDQRLSELLIRVARIEGQMALTGHPMQTPAAATEPTSSAQASARVEELGQRVTQLERRNEELVAALKKTLGLLATLRSDTATTTKVA
jgi:hypothetical protein